MMRDICEALVIACVRNEEVTERSEIVRQRLQDVNAALEAALKREQIITQTLQRPLTKEVAANAFADLTVATLYESALAEAEVGGDSFDAFALPDGRIALAVADASGKGLSAAVRAIQVKDVLRAFSRENPNSVADIVTRLNDFVYDEQTLDGQYTGGFVTLALAIVDPAKGVGSVVSAGSEPPLIVRGDGTTQIFRNYGLPLGVERQQVYSEVLFLLGRGDTLALFTDGITEARNGGEFLGHEGVVTLLQKALFPVPAGGSPPVLREAGKSVMRGARAFGAGVLQDDACLLLACRD